MPELYPDTPPEILQRMILAHSHRIQECVDRMTVLREAFIEAEKICNVSCGRVYLATPGTIGEREAAVNAQCADEIAKKHAAELAMKDNKSAADKLADSMNGIQSVLSGRREEMRLARIGDGP